MDSINICNLALARLGLPAITSFDEAGNVAQTCRTLFPVCRDRVLRDHLWSFATAFFPLSAAAEPSPDPAYGVAAHLPGDLVRIIRIAEDMPFRRIGHLICLPGLPATLVYIRQVTNTELFDSAFCEALAYLLASEIAMSNTRDAGLVRTFAEEYRARIAAARSIDSQENVHALQTSRRRSSFIAARAAGSLSPGRCGSRVVITSGTEGAE